MSILLIQLNAKVVMATVSKQTAPLSHCRVEEYDYQYLGNDEPEYLTNYLRDELKEITVWCYSKSLIKFLDSQGYREGIFQYSGKIQLIPNYNEKEGWFDVDVNYCDYDVTRIPETVEDPTPVDPAP